MRSNKTLAQVTSSPDSLRVTVTVLNLSEDLTGNDELLILCYRYNDSLRLNVPIFVNRLTFRSRNTSRKVNVRIDEDDFKEALIVFVIEQDSDLPIEKIDSTLRVSHTSIRKEFSARHYTGIEAYLEDEDILGIRVIPPLNCSEPYMTILTGVYKLDRFEYEVTIECL